MLDAILPFLSRPCRGGMFSRARNRWLHVAHRHLWWRRAACHRLPSVGASGAGSFRHHDPRHDARDPARDVAIPDLMTSIQPSRNAFAPSAYMTRRASPSRWRGGCSGGRVGRSLRQSMTGRSRSPTVRRSSPIRVRSPRREAPLLGRQKLARERRLAGAVWRGDDDDLLLVGHAATSLSTPGGLSPLSWVRAGWQVWIGCRHLRFVCATVRFGRATRVSSVRRCVSSV